MRGRVKWFNNDKGYGFITAPDGADVFVHHTALRVDGYRTLVEGEEVEFERTEARNGFQASDVYRLRDLGDNVKDPDVPPHVDSGASESMKPGVTSAGSHSASTQSQRAAPRQVLRVFVCHGSEDKVKVRELVSRLRTGPVDPWLDEEKLLPGHDWRLEIGKAIRAAHAVVVCLSTKSVSKTGFVQKEIREALDVADEQPEGSIFLIPVKLDDCQVPQRLQKWHWVKLDEPNGFERLLAALSARASDAGLSWR